MSSIMAARLYIRVKWTRRRGRRELLNFRVTNDPLCTWNLSPL